MFSSAGAKSRPSTAQSQVTEQSKVLAQQASTYSAEAAKRASQYSKVRAQVKLDPLVVRD